jgi:hypothetical protein
MRSVIENITGPSKQALAGLSKQIRRAIRAGLSHDAIDAAQPTSYKYQDKTVTNKTGKKYRFGRRIINYERKGPLHRQVGIRWLHGESWPIMQSYFTHRFLHATKGWREYTGGPALRMPMAAMAGNTPYPLRFFGRNHRWA